MIFQIKVAFLKFYSGINFKIKNKIKKSIIIKLSDIFYVENLSFGIKYYMYLKISIKDDFLWT
jgi:hypothetical protein